MKGHGPRHERETIINFNEEEETASIWTASEPVYRKLLKRLGSEYLTEDGERHAVFTFPSNFLGLPRVKAKRALDPDRRLNWQIALAKHGKLSGAGTKNGVL